MAVPLSKEVLFQIEGLIIDALQVVSYKWLSRKLSVSSNMAKRFLEEFALHNQCSELQVVYAVSGWTNKEPQCYAVQLVPKAKLEGVRAALKGTPSIHIYSVQRCLPKDPAQLWSADFVQAEQLFNDPPEVDNCLRDNRFSAVTCSLVKRNLKGKNFRPTSSVRLPPPADKPTIVQHSPSNDSRIPRAAAPPPPPALNKLSADAKAGSRTKLEAPPSAPPSSIQPKPKDVALVGVATTGSVVVTAESDKKKAGTGPIPGKEGSIASLWGKASTKPPKAPSSPKVSVMIPKLPSALTTLAGDAEAQIQALEADAGSDDDEGEFASLRRGPSSGGGRRRRMIVEDDDSGQEKADEDDGEMIVRLGTPDSSPAEKKFMSIPNKDPPFIPEMVTSRGHDDLSDPKDEKRKPRLKLVKSEVKAVIQTVSSKMQTDVGSLSLSIKSQEKATEKRPSVPDGPQEVSKRKKVLKTRIDGRGREVTEVVWETEGAEMKSNETVLGLAKALASSSKHNDANPSTERSQAVQKPPLIIPVKTPPVKVNSKNAAKGGGKQGNKQGNIMAFFKKA